MNFLLAFCLLAVLSCSLALPLQSYTITGGESDTYDGSKWVLDTTNQRFFQEDYFYAQSNTWTSQLIVLPSITYRKTIANGVCSCKKQTNFGYSNLISLWNALSLQSDNGIVSKYSGSFKDAPACSSYSAYPYTWFVNDADLAPINVTYPTSSGPWSTFVRNSYSSVVDSSVFSLGCCSQATLSIC